MEELWSVCFFGQWMIAGTIILVFAGTILRMIVGYIKVVKETREMNNET